MELESNMKAPAFSLKDQNGETRKLSDYKGQWVLVYFYPKDNTPGCTKEACALKDSYSDFKKIKAVVLGVSGDSVESHAGFASKFNLPFLLLADTNKKVLEKYGVWREKVMFGRKYMGIKRMSFLVDPKGKIAKVYKTVKPAEHANQVLKDLAELQ